MSEHSEEHRSHDPSSNHRVDGAILNARSCLSLLKDQLLTLSNEVSRSSELNVESGDGSSIGGVNIVNNNNKRINNTTTSEGQMSPRSSTYSGDTPHATTTDSTPSVVHPRNRNQSSEKGLFRTEENSLESDTQWRIMDERVSEAGTYSEDHEGYRSLVDLHEVSSSSSRSWSLGRSVSGFGPNGTDLILHRESSRGSSSIPTATSTTTTGAQNRRFDSPFRSELYQLTESNGKNATTAPLMNSKKENNPESWILNSVLPFSCWPKEEINDFRWSTTNSALKNTTSTVNQHNIRNLQNRTGNKISKINYAVRNAIGKIWDENSMESAHCLWNLVNTFLTNEEDGKIDPMSCWVSGRATYNAADGLPFAFTIHTYSSLCKPCISGHANVTVEVTPMDSQNADAFEKAINEYEQRAYGLSSKSSFSLPEPLSPYRRDSPTPHWQSRQQLLSSDFETVPPLFPIHEQGDSGLLLEGRRHRRDAQIAKDARSESNSTFSFNSIAPGKKVNDQPASGSSETHSTADLTGFIRHAHEANKQQQQQQASTSGNQRTGWSSDQPSSSSGNHNHRRRQKDGSGGSQQKTVFSELDLVWEMHYPDFEKLETVIASRKYQRNKEQDLKGSTYIGDTDSETSSEDSEPSNTRELVLHEDHHPEIEEGAELRSREGLSSTQMVVRNPEPALDRDQNPWDGVMQPYHEVRTDPQRLFLTDSMEVNFEDDRERHRKWGRIQKLSSFVRRVKKMIGTSSTTDNRKQQVLPTIQSIEAIKESPEHEYEERVGFYSPESSTPREDRRVGAVGQSSTSPVRSTEGYYSAPSTESEVHQADANLANEGRSPSSPTETPTTRKSNESSVVPFQDSNLVLTGTSFASSIGCSSQNVSWDETRSVKLPVKDLGNGQYLALGHLTGQGRYQVNIKIGNKKMFEEPFITTVLDPSMLGSGITSEGPFYQRPDGLQVTSTSTVPIPHPSYPPCHSVSYDPERLDYALRHPHLGYVDLLFVVDCTSSMGQELQQLPSLVNGIEELVKDSVLLKRLRMGVIAYRDHDPEDEDTFLLRKQDLTEDIEKVKRFLGGLEAEGGGDYPEALEVAFEEAVEGIKWGLFSSRLVLWIGDAPPHGYQGFTHKQALEEESRFKTAKSNLKKAAYSVEVAMKNEESTQMLNVHDKELADALIACDTIAKYHDKYPLGIPGRVRWEETVERLSSIGVRVIVMGLRSAISHDASRNCLRAIAHISGGALLEVVTLDSSVIAPLIVAIVEQELDEQLIEEEVCDLILCLKNDFEHESLQDKKRNVVESMSQAAKQPHRLQVAPKSSFSDSPTPSRIEQPHGVVPYELEQGPSQRSGLSRSDSRSSNVPSSRSSGGGGSLGPLTISGASFDVHSVSTKLDSRALLLGMVSIRFDEEILEQTLRNLKSKSEIVSQCLISNFESPEQWFEFHLCHVSNGLYKGESQKIHGLTAPLSLRYLLAVHTMAQKH